MSCLFNVTRLRRSLARLLVCSLLTFCILGCREDSQVATPNTTGNQVARTFPELPIHDPSVHKPTVTTVAAGRRASTYLRQLSQYNLFQGELSALQPVRGVLPYDVNTPLFTDYASKHRVIRIPEGTSAKYQADDVFDFPVGTVIAKTFCYVDDMTDPTSGRQLIETRIMLLQESGWIGLPYIWNQEQTDAELSLTGGDADVDWIHVDGRSRHNTHLVPNFNDCKRCHENQRFEPIGLRARHLNRDFAYDHGSENQLTYWTRSGKLSGAPPAEQAPRLAVWNDKSTGSLDQRARAWLEMNCAHCHNPIGPARNSGLHLHADVSDSYRLGIFKTPVAAGRGTGGRLYDIVPGEPDASILMYRLLSDHVGEMMPEIGRSLIDEEGTELIREWIQHLVEPNSML